MLNFRNMIMMSAIALGTSFGMAAQATTYTWDFASQFNAGPVGSSSHSYVATGGPNAPTLLAHGYSAEHSDTGNHIVNGVWKTGDVSNAELYNKYTSGDTTETGLGLNKTSQNEITPSTFIQFDVANLISGKYTNLTFKISSIQQGEGFNVWGSNQAGAPGQFLQTFTDQSGSNLIDSFLAPLYGTYKYYSIGATFGNVLVQNGVSVDAPAVPEASTSVGFSSLLVIGGLSMVRRRRVGATKLA